MTRVALCLGQLLGQVNAKAPARSKASDGAISSAAHRKQNPDSDHDPDLDGVVHARDFTHDPAHGFDSYAFADQLLKAQDVRLKYVISNRRIGSGPSGPKPGVWRPYNGANPHDHHAHVSVVSGPLADSRKTWHLGGLWKPAGLSKAITDRIQQEDDTVTLYIDDDKHDAYLVAPWRKQWRAVRGSELTSLAASLPVVRGRAFKRIAVEFYGTLSTYAEVK